MKSFSFNEILKFLVVVYYQLYEILLETTLIKGEK